MRRILTLTVAMAVMLALAVPAAAAKNNQVSGIADFNDPNCGGLNLMHDGEGWGLKGCLVIETYEVKKYENGTYQERGTERFTGEVWYGNNNLGNGTFATTYNFTAKLAEPGNLDTEIFGRCQHPITLGTGVFAGVTGRLDFKDVLEGEGAPYFPYRGHMKLPGLES